MSYALEVNALGSAAAARTKRLAVTAAHFHVKKPRPLPAWLLKGLGEDTVDDLQLALAINGRLNLYAARQRLALAAACLPLCRYGWLPGRCAARLSAQLADRRAAQAPPPVVLAEALGAELRPWYRPPHHYIAAQPAVSREGLELSSRVIRNLLPGEPVAALEVLPPGPEIQHTSLRFVFWHELVC